NGNTYLFTDKGIITTGWHSSDSNLYYFNKDGHMCKGSKTIDQRKYYFNTSNGELMSMTAPIPYYMQTDSRWANKKYGSGTMASTGCAQTCAAMAFSFLKNQTILPPDVASWGYKNGYYNGKVTGTIGSFWPAISKHYGIACQGNLTVDQAIDALRHGKLVVAGMNPPNFTFEGTTHEIIIYGIDENNMVSVYDPYFKSHNKKYSIKQIFKEKSTDKGDCTSGGPIFALG
ncbi:MULTISPECIES: C39 family peptidase, partial [Erysipelotrichaceae]